MLTRSLILCVDDEKIVLDSLKIQLGQIFQGEPVIIETAESGEEGLEILKDYSCSIEDEDDILIALVISDMIMPSMKGSEFLEIVHGKYPETMKILLTGQSEKEDILETISKVHLYRYFAKPWDKIDFNMTVREAVLSYWQTKEIELQRDQLLTLNENLEKRVKERTTELQVKNKMMTDSINYAKRIQDGIFVDIKEVQQFVKSFFVLYRPMHVLSGDFYFFSKIEDKIIVVAVDCTGHGVPGALMSIIASVHLNRIINVQKHTDPVYILNELHIGVVKSLNQNHSGIEDGMDVAICAYDTINKEITFSGAKRPLIYIKNKELHHIKGGRLPIGGLVNYERIYQNHTFKVDSDTMFYVFSDGYTDQFGGKNAERFKIGRFKDLVSEIYEKSAIEQKEILEHTINEWKQGIAQTDDILVIGFKLENLIELS